MAFTTISCGGSLEEKFSINDIDVVKMNGLSSVIIAIEVDNSSRHAIEVMELDMVVKLKGKTLVKATLSDEVRFEKRAVSRVETKWKLSSISLLSGVGAALNFIKPSANRENYTIDYTIKGRTGVLTRSLHREGVPVNSLIKMN